MGNVMGKLFQEHKRKERAGAQPNLESWAGLRQQLQPGIITERWHSFCKQVLGDQLGSQVPEKVQEFTLISC